MEKAVKIGHSMQKHADDLQQFAERAEFVDGKSGDWYNAVMKQSKRLQMREGALQSPPVA
ncbi:MAG: hypothetical protein LKE85_05040 [Lachnospiraceae bacterium]|jgi:hypothetical protein|nr:hypothetical protein [Lachnospiraceae bacterium]